MKKFRVLAVVLIGLAVVLPLMAGPKTPANSGTMSGAELLKYCSEDMAGTGPFVCIGYITGVADVIGDADGSHRRVCYPNESNGALAARFLMVTVRYLKEHFDEARGRSAKSLVAAALSEAFPCKGGAPD